MASLLRVSSNFVGAVLLLVTAGVAWGACTIQPIDFGQTRNGTIATDDCANNSNNTTYFYDSYTFQAVAGQKIAVQMNSTASTLQPYLFLVVNNNIPGALSAGANGSFNATTARIPASGFLTLSQSGTYEIQAVSAGALQTGSYTLSLTSSTPASCAVAANPQSSATLPLAAGTSVTISAVCGSGNTPITYTWDSGAFTGATRTVTPTQTTTYNIVASNSEGSSAPFSITVFVAAPPPGVPTVEFYNINLAHYFVTAVQAEATAIDSGSAGPGWVRTGFSYDVYNGPVNQGGIQTVPVCRFYGTPGKGPNSHFYTADATECEQVKRDPGWTYEGIAYHIQPWLGSCPAGTQPIYRTYNNRAAQNDSNHRFITNAATYQQMSDKGWNAEGTVMCTAAVRSPTPVLGGTFNDPSGSGAGMSVSTPELPPYVNATQPQTAPSRQGGLPPAMTNPSIGETNVTSGSSGGYDFNLTGDSGFTTTTQGAVTVSVPFNAAALPPGDGVNPARTFVRIHDPGDGTQVDVTGVNTVNGNSGLVTISTQGLPASFVASVVHNPDTVALGSDEPVPGEGPASIPLKSASATTWPAQAWCLMGNARSPSLLAAVRSYYNLSGNPTLNDIKRFVKERVINPVLAAQATMQNDNLAAPNLRIGSHVCGGTQPRYMLHLVEDGQPKFRLEEPGAGVDSLTGLGYGRVYITTNYLNVPTSNATNGTGGAIAHELLHAVQSSYRLLGSTTGSYLEGSATVYGKTFDFNGAITVRPTRILMLSSELLNPKGTNRYGSEDFWAYIARAYNSDKLEYLSGLYAQMRITLGNNSYNPDRATLYGALDTFLKAKFNRSLQEIYLDFLRQRALSHNAASQFGRPGEVTSGPAENLFEANSIGRRTIDVGNCATQKVTVNATFSPFASPLILITPTGSLPSGNTSGVPLSAKIIVNNSSVGDKWNGWTSWNSAVTALQEVNRFAGFGKSSSDQVALVVANLDATNSRSFSVEITCGGVKIDSLSPSRGKVGDVITINGSGFGNANDTRRVTFNGVSSTSVTWVSDSQLRATVPPNASTGNVIVTVGNEISNGVSFELVSACSATQNAGADAPDTRTVELGKTAGTFNFSYQTFSQKDQIIVRYQNAVLFDTGCVGAAATVPITYSGTQTFITVQVIPNCAGGTGTAWNYTVSCP